MTRGKEINPSHAICANKRLVQQLPFAIVPFWLGGIKTGLQVFWWGKYKASPVRKDNTDFSGVAAKPWIWLHAAHHWADDFSVTEALIEINSTFPEKEISRSTVYRWYRKIKNGTCDAPRKVWQRRRRLPIVDDLVELVKKSTYSTSWNLAKFLNCSKKYHS